MNEGPASRRLPARTKRVPLTRGEIMARVGQRDTAPELGLRRALWSVGLRYRVAIRLEGVLVDLAFPGAMVAVFVDGCFWHGCPSHGTLPKSNEPYWTQKLADNRRRDIRQTERLTQAGWYVVRAWEHEMDQGFAATVALIASLVRKGRRS